MIKKIIKIASATLAIRVFGSFLGFLLALKLAHALGANALGVYALGITLTVLISTVSRVGLDYTVTKLVAAQKASDTNNNGIRVLLIAVSIT